MSSQSEGSAYSCTGAPARGGPDDGLGATGGGCPPDATGCCLDASLSTSSMISHISSSSKPLEGTGAGAAFGGGRGGVGGGRGGGGGARASIPLSPKSSKDFQNSSSSSGSVSLKDGPGPREVVVPAMLDSAPDVAGGEEAREEGEDRGGRELAWPVSIAWFCST